MLGVGENYLAQAPSPSSYPTKFNQRAKPLWVKILDSAEYKLRLANFTNYQDRWNYCIRLFVRVCRENGIDAFNQSVDQVDNALMMSYLTMKRMVVTRFFNYRKILKQFKIRKPYRAYLWSANDLRIRSYCTLYKYGSQTDLEKFIGSRKCGFVRTTGPSRWHYVIDQMTRVVIETGLPESTMWYEIRALGTVYVPGSELKPVTNGQLSNFIDQQVWGMIVRSHPFEGLISRF